MTWRSPSRFSACFGNKQTTNTSTVSNIRIRRIFYHFLTDSLEITDLTHSSDIASIMYSTRILALAAAIAAPVPAFAVLYENHGSSARLVPGKFIVKVKDTVSQDTVNEVENLMDDIDYVYNVSLFRGFAGRINDAALESLQAHPGVCQLAICFIDLTSSFKRC